MIVCVLYVHTLLLLTVISAALSMHKRCRAAQRCDIELLNYLNIKYITRVLKKF